MAPPLLTLQNIHLSFGGEPLLSGAELSLSAFERLCLVGRNGCGKSSLLKIAAGYLEPDEGERFLQPGVQVGVLEQEPDFSGFETVHDFVTDGLLENEAYKVDPLLDALQLDKGLATAHLSGGQARRAALVQVLAREPDVLFLDEPTNHLDLPAIEWLEAYLAKSRASLVVISHDRRFLETVSNKVLWIDRGHTRLLDKGFAGFEAWRDEVFAQEELDAHKRERKIAAEEDWLRYGVTARRKRNQKRLADLHQLRADRDAHKGPQGRAVLQVSEGATSSKVVVEAEGLSKGFDGEVLIKDLSLKLQRGERLGIVGPNGAGKTTLVKLLTGALPPDRGTVRLGQSLELVHLDQGREGLKEGWTLADALTNGGGDYVDIAGQKKHVMGYMKDFLFDPGQARTPLEVLSGGERARVMLARALSLPSNVMILDEPTNDLDLETLDLLEEMLAAYKGTVLLVSHDRDFLDRVVHSVLVFEGDGHWGLYRGGYSQAEALLAMREKRCSRVLKSSSAKKSETPTDGSPIKAANRLSYKEKYALETLPGEIEALEGEVHKFEVVLADADLYQKDPSRFHEATAALAKAMADLEALQERWLELEIKREALEANGVSSV